MLELRNICMRREGRTLLDGVNLHLAQGEIRVLAGPSGAGKTSLLRCIAGLEAPDAGFIQISDQVVFNHRQTNVPPHARNVSMSFQDGALWPHFSIEKHLRFGLERRLPDKAARDALVNALLDLAKLGSRRKEQPGKLSGGERQRVGLIRALAQQPKLLLLDEPLAHVDYRARMELARELFGYIKNSGITALWVTHQVDELAFLETHMSLLEAGRLDGSIPMSRFVCGFSTYPEPDAAVGSE